MSAYFVNEGAYPPEGDRFWLRGRSRADVLLRAGSVVVVSDPVPLRVRSWSIEITNGSVPNRVTIRSGWRRASLDLAAGEVRTVDLGAGSGVPYKPTRVPTNYVYSLSFSTSAGFAPFLEDTANSDSRYLGAMVRLVPVYFSP